MQRESLYKRYIPLVKAPENIDKAFWLAFSGGKLLLNGKPPLVPSAGSLEDLGIRPVRTQYLGTLEGQPCFSAELPADSRTPEGMTFTDLRSAYTMMDEDLWILAGRAIQIVAWDQTHQYCGRCGKQTENLDGERAKRCPACGFMSFPRLSPATITAVFKDNKILLARNSAFVRRWYSICAGFVEPGETLEECVHREIKEEVGIETKNIKYFGSQSWPFPNSLMLGFTAEWAGGDIKPDGKEITEADWFSADNMPDIPSKISISREIIDWFLEGKPVRTNG
jgi:NAD+ diphosphatase